jgi:LCP family protein required for cell wall assembly
MEPDREDLRQTGREEEDKPDTSHSRRGTLRLVLIVVSALVLVLVLGVGGLYAWFAVSMSKANRQPGMDEARQALREALPPSSTTSSRSSSTGTSGSTTTTSTTLAPPIEKPGTMNILVIGADRRPESEEKWGRSDTMMIAHIDPQADYLSILSLPRDLRVNIAGHGTQKLNAAYALGGDGLAIRTIRQVTGLKIDHYVRVDLKAFEAIVNEIGGVYVDVDRRYFDSGDVLLRINLQPGYQRLDGDQALRYVRIRHDQDHDWARIQRQQQFLRAAKEQVFSWDMALRIPPTVGTLMRHMATEIEAREALRLAWWSAQLDMNRVKQVAMRGKDQMIDGLAYVVATDSQIRAAVNDLMTPPPDTQPTTTTLPDSADRSPRNPSLDFSDAYVEVRAAGGSADQVSSCWRFLADHGAQVASGAKEAAPRDQSEVVYPAQMERSRTAEAARVAMALGIRTLREDNSLRHVVVFVGRDFTPPEPDATLATVEQAQWRYASEKAGLALEAPGWLPRNYDFAGSRAYYLATDAKDKPAVRFTYKLRGDEQYLGITATTFLDSPAASAGEQVTEAETTFTIVGTADRVERVWWKRNGVLYWVSNTLGSALTRDQLLDIARSASPIESL